MYIHTTEAAKLLNMSSRRLLQLLQQGRVIGAYKSGHCWIIPLYDGLPQITKGKRGRPGTWNTKRVQKKTVVHINGNNIKQNAKRTPEERKPVITIKSNGACNGSIGEEGKGKKNTYANALEIPYPCRIVYEPDKPLSCGARVWIEVLGQDLVAIQPPANIVYHGL